MTMNWLNSANLPEQAEFNCLPTHLGVFCPPVCTKCNPCASRNCDCPPIPDCNQFDSCQPHYERVRYVQSCNIHVPKSNCPTYDLTQRRREGYKPLYICKTQLVSTHYDTVYRRSFDLPTCNPPPY